MISAALKAMVPYALLLAVAAYLYHNTATFANLGRPGQLGPDFWPRVVLALLMLVCLVEMVRAVFVTRADERRERERAAQGRAKLDLGEEKRYPLLLAGGIVLTALYVPGIQLLGFFLATTVYLALFMAIGRYRRKLVIAVTSLAGSLAFMFVFMKVVYVSLPLGAGPFRHVSTAVMALLGIH